MMRPNASWEGSTGELYCCGKATAGKMQLDERIRGRKVRNVCVDSSDEVVLVQDAWELEWYNTHAHMKNKMEGEQQQQQWEQKQQQQREQQELIQHALKEVKVQQLATGKEHSLALTLDGTLYSWGASSFGQLGLGPLKKQSQVPTAVREKGLVFTQLAMGAYHSAAVTNTGDLYTFGRGFEGQTGHGLSTLHSAINQAWYGIVPVPKFVGALRGQSVVSVACGAHFTAVVTAAGEVWAFGEASLGQVGRGKETASMTPRRTLAISDGDGSAFTHVACGWAHTLALTTLGHLYAFGCNVYGQLGVGDTKPRFQPDRIATTPLKQVLFTKVAAGGNYSVAITEDGAMYSWGNGTFGKLGHGVEQHELVPRKIDCLDAQYVLSALCTPENMYVFCPTWVTQLHPSRGPATGGTELCISGSGFWDSDDVTVRFAPTSEGRLTRGALGEYDAKTRTIKCVVPKFAVPGDVYVEVAMNGKHFTSNKTVFSTYLPPSCESLSVQDGPISGGFDVSIKLRGTVSSGPFWVAFADIARPDVREVVEAFKVEYPETGKPESEATDQLTISCKAPDFSHAGMATCSLQLSLNATQFDPLQIKMDEFKYRDAQIIFHRAEVHQITPNSSLLSSKNTQIVITGKDFFDIGQTTVKLLCVIDASEDNYTYAYVYSNDCSTKKNSITCTIPELHEWEYATAEGNDDDLVFQSDRATKTKPKPKIIWWEKLKSSIARVQVTVSLNGERNQLPSVKDSDSSFYFLTPGEITSVLPIYVPTTGGTKMAITSDFFTFDGTIPRIRMSMPDGEKIIVNAQMVMSAELRQMVFDAPALSDFYATSSIEANKVDTTEMEENPEPSQSSEEDPAETLISLFKVAEIAASLNGLDFSTNTLSIQYYELPSVSEVEPTQGPETTEVVIRGTGFFPVDDILIRVTNPTSGQETTLSATHEIFPGEETSALCFTIPSLPRTFLGVNHLSFSMNGQQFHPVDAEEATFTYQIINEE